MSPAEYQEAADRIWQQWGNRLEGWTLLFNLASEHKSGKPDWPFTERELIAGLYDEVHAAADKQLERFRVMLPLIERDASVITEVEGGLLCGLFTRYAYRLRERLDSAERARAARILRRWLIASTPAGEAIFAPAELARYQALGDWRSDATSHHTIDLSTSVFVVLMLEGHERDSGREG